MSTRWIAPPLEAGRGGWRLLITARDLLYAVLRARRHRVIAPQNRHPTRPDRRRRRARGVDRFIEPLLVNDMLNANPAIKAARDRNPRRRA